MSNLHRLKVTDKIFFVTCNLHIGRRELIDHDFAIILKVIEESRRKLEFLFCGYVLMPDHWHALIFPRFPLTISKVMERIKSVSAGRLNRGSSHDRHNWQHQFWDRFVRDKEEFWERLDYMHFNPVRRNLVTKPGEWRWSSYNNFSLEPADIAACPIQVDYVQLSDSYHA
jgi:REP element-mobilizing transposase RayT